MVLDEEGPSDYTHISCNPKILGFALLQRSLSDKWRLSRPLE